jgi:hypothetical protein
MPEPVDAAASAMPRDIRLWLRVVPALRWRMKLAAAVLGQTSQRFLVEALDRAMAEGVTAADDPLAARALGESVGSRVKLALWVDNGRRSTMRLATAARHETQQGFLHAALAAHLRHFAPSSLLLLPPGAGVGAEIIAFPHPSTEPPGDTATSCASAKRWRPVWASASFRATPANLPASTAIGRYFPEASSPGMRKFAAKTID